MAAVNVMMIMMVEADDGLDDCDDNGIRDDNGMITKMLMTVVTIEVQILITGLVEKTSLNLLWLSRWR